jgi:dihydrofolate reductase
VQEDVMSKLTVVNNLSLDGVMQAPGRPDEDRRGGFKHGGWAIPYNDAVLGELMGRRMGSYAGALLLGRRTYEDFAGFWPKQQDNPFTDVLNETQKYVASRTLHEPLAWANSALLDGDAAEAVARLKQEKPDQDLTVLGSGDLLQTLMRHGLVDAYVLLTHPLVLGSGRRMFPASSANSALRLVDSVPTTTGVIVATYERA